MINRRANHEEDGIMRISRSSLRAGGFTTLDMLIVIVIIGILATVAFPRYFEVKDRSMVGAAQADLTLLRQALACYAADYDAYPQDLASLEDMVQVVIDPNGRPYLSLPSGATFEWQSYALNGTGDYVLRVKALDKNGTVLRATADRISIES